MKVLLCHQAPSSDPSASSDSTSQTIQAYPPLPPRSLPFYLSPLFTSPKHSKLPDIALFNKVKFKKRVAFRGMVSTLKAHLSLKKWYLPPLVLSPLKTYFCNPTFPKM